MVPVSISICFFISVSWQKINIDLYIHVCQHQNLQSGSIKKVSAKDTYAHLLARSDHCFRLERPLTEAKFIEPFPATLPPETEKIRTHRRSYHKSSVQYVSPSINKVKNEAACFQSCRVQI